MPGSGPVAQRDVLGRQRGVAGAQQELAVHVGSAPTAAQSMREPWASLPGSAAARGQAGGQAERFLADRPSLPSTQPDGRPALSHGGVPLGLIGVSTDHEAGPHHPVVDHHLLDRQVAGHVVVARRLRTAPQWPPSFAAKKKAQSSIRKALLKQEQIREGPALVNLLKVGNPVGWICDYTTCGGRRSEIYYFSVAFADYFL